MILAQCRLFDDERRGLAVRAYIAVTPIDYSKEAEIPAKLQDIEGIISCDSVAGSPSYMLTVRAASPSKLEDLLNVIHQNGAGEHGNHDCAATVLLQVTCAR